MTSTPLPSIRNALMAQVQHAAKGSVETSVRTYITRALWRMWCVSVGDDPESEPTGWTADGNCHRVYGSETVIVESPEFWSFSLKV